MPLPPGARLGPYEILSLVGAGGMGEVYKSRDTRLDRTVAIKILPDTLAADPNLGGETLAQRLASGSGLAASGKALPLNEALTIAIQIADALDKAHRAGIIHRDQVPDGPAEGASPGQRVRGDPRAELARGVEGARAGEIDR